MYLLYCGLLVIWVLLLWPMFRLKGGARGWLLVVIVAGIAALFHEIRMFLWSFAAIRLDILWISMALVCLYGSAAALLFFKHWHRAASLLAIAVVVIGGGMSYEWILAGRESQRLREVFVRAAMRSASGARESSFSTNNLRNSSRRATDRGYTRPRVEAWRGS